MAQSRLPPALAAGVLPVTVGNSMRRVFEQTAPGFSSLQDFFAKWLNMDITTLAVALTMFGAISTGTSHIRHIALEVYRWVVRFFTASVSIPGHDRLNSEVLNWVGAHVLTQQQTRILTARSEHTMNEAWEFRRPGSRRIDFQVEKRLPIQYLPTFGVTWFFHERNVFLVRRIPDGRDFIPLDGDDAPDHYAVAPAGTEPLVVMCLGRSVRPIKRFLTACRNFASKQRESFITVRISRNQYHHDTWDTTILRPMRPLNTVHMEQAVKDELLADVENYLKPSTRRFYTNRGIPYRRGYLLHGPPGTGKTSLSLALAGRFGLELYILHIPSLSEDGELERLFTSLPPKCIVLLEDIDAVGMKRSYDDSSDSDSPRDRRSRHRRLKSRGGGGSTNCTLSGLLNVLDGVTSQEGRIVLMTSNVVDQLDEALVRPGRIDKMIFMGKIRAEAAEDMFLRMFAPDEESSSIINNIGSFDFDDVDSSKPTPTGSALKKPQLDQVDAISEQELRDLAVGFGRSIPDDMFTPAQLQGYLLNHRDQPARAVAQLSAWIEEEKERMAAAREREEKQRKKREARRQEELEKEMARFVPYGNGMRTPPHPPTSGDGSPSGPMPSHHHPGPEVVWVTSRRQRRRVPDETGKKSSGAAGAKSTTESRRKGKKKEATTASGDKRSSSSAPEDTADAAGAEGGESEEKKDTVETEVAGESQEEGTDSSYISAVSSSDEGSESDSDTSEAYNDAATQTVDAAKQEEGGPAENNTEAVQEKQAEA